MAYPSTFADLKAAVIAKTRLDSTADATRVADWINQVYAQVCIETECLQQAATMTLAANSATYTVPASVVRMKRVVIQPTGGSYGPPLEQVGLDEILWRRNANGSSAVANGTATMFALVGMNQLELWPTPAGADSLEMFYVYQPTALSGATDVPAIPEPYASKVLEYGALAEAADFTADIIGKFDYRQMYQIWLGKFQTHMSRRSGSQTGQLAIHRRFTGLPHDNSADVRWAN